MLEHPLIDKIEAEIKEHAANKRFCAIGAGR